MNYDHFNRFVIVVILGLSSQVALGQAGGDEAVTPKGSSPSLPEVPESGKTKEDLGNTPDSFGPAVLISEGLPIAIPGVSGVSVTPPKDWEIISRSPSLSLILQQPQDKKAKIDYSKPIFQRNITLAVMHQPSPIDEKRIAELNKELLATFGRDSLVKDFRIIEQKLFNFRERDDGILVFTSMMLADFPIMQMHVLVSSDEKQFLMSYTDLNSEFAKSNEHFTSAWNSMLSLSFNGKPPRRYQQYLPHAIAATAGFLLVLILLVLRSRAQRTDYIKFADESIYGAGAGSDSDIPTERQAMTMSRVWNLEQRQAQNQGGGFSAFMTFYSEVANPKESKRQSEKIKVRTVGSEVEQQTTSF